MFNYLIIKSENSCYKKGNRKNTVVFSSDNGIFADFHDLHAVPEFCQETIVAKTGTLSTKFNLISCTFF
jgi:hypothetical protein